MVRHRAVVAWGWRRRFRTVPSTSARRSFSPSCPPLRRRFVDSESPLPTAPPPVAASPRLAPSTPTFPRPRPRPPLSGAPPRVSPDGFDPEHVPNVRRFVLNPVTNQMSRLPPRVARLNGDAGPLFDVHMGLVTQADRRHGPPDRVAVAELPEGDLMLRFLSEKGKWETVAVSPCRLPSARLRVINASVPKLLLDDAFEQKNDIAKAVEDELEKAMSAYGFEIVQTLIVDIDPDEHVK
ncbi:hypothetical protein QYE76_034397 [Lolium multiflorum]|uniref:Band 7 domain-containing protein n=1 Tax=Lolium multiflorum TaxID=4521 RepID=A0AAD8R0I5_LOLMU|nr:hypothetical protein QYE76_034397 [Lolium multiflorum]